jgi:hypothetical protein
MFSHFRMLGSLQYHPVVFDGSSNSASSRATRLGCCGLRMLDWDRTVLLFNFEAGNEHRPYHVSDVFLLNLV